MKCQDPVFKRYEIPRKTTKIFELKCALNNVPIDITDWTFYFTLKKKMEDSDAEAKISKKEDDHDNGENGIALITLTPDDTDLDVGRYYYSIDYKNDNDENGVLFHGTIKIFDSVRDTRD